MPTLNPLSPTSLIVFESPLTVDETAHRLLKVLSLKGFTVFADVNHAAEARKVDLDMPEERVIIFGEPSVGTELMLESPRIGMELPLRVLIWADGDGMTRLGYLDLISLGVSYNIVNNSELLKRMDLGISNMITEALRT